MEEGDAYVCFDVSMWRRQSIHTCSLCIEATYARIQSHIYAHIQAYTYANIQASIRKNGREDLVFLILGWVGLLIKMIIIVILIVIIIIIVIIIVIIIIITTVIIIIIIII